jgi:hypothetical protein
MRQEGLLEETPWALVDVGWTLGTQAALREVLRRERPGTETRGFYLGLRKDRLPEDRAGKAWGFAREEDANPDGRALVMQFSLLEQLATPAPHGTTVGYRKTPAQRWEPVLAEGCRFVPAEACEAIAAVYVDLARRATERGLPSLAPDIALALCRRFFLFPDAGDRRSLAGAEVATDPGEHDRRPVVGVFGSAELLAFVWKNLVRRGRGGYYRRRFMWMAASIPRWDLPMRFLFWLLVKCGRHGAGMA